MKNLYLLVIAMFMAFSVTAQEDQYYDEEYSEEQPYVEPEPNCLQKYTKVFQERGAEKVADGTYDDVIVVIEGPTSTDCFTGKVNVYQSKMAPSTIKLATANGDYTDGPKTRSLPLPIKDGFANAYMDEKGSRITVIFPKSLKPKQEELKKAPDPILD